MWSSEHHLRRRADISRDNIFFLIRGWTTSPVLIITATRPREVIGMEFLYSSFFHTCKHLGPTTFVFSCLFTYKGSSSFLTRSLKLFVNRCASTMQEKVEMGRNYYEENHITLQLTEIFFSRKSWYMEYILFCMNCWELEN